MTREEVIEELTAILEMDYKNVPLSKAALEIAIKALEHPEKNVVAVVPCGDCVSRADVLKLMQDNWHTHNGDWAMQESMDDIRVLPSVTPQEPMVEIDLYSVIKQKYIEREVLDKIRAEIEQTTSRYSISRERGGMGQVEWSDNLIKESEVLEIIDKYKADVEPQESEDKE